MSRRIPACLAVASTTMTPALALAPLDAAPDAAVVVRLEPAPDDMRLRWSPKGESIALAPGPDGALCGVFSLEPFGSLGVVLELRRSFAGEPFDRLALDLDRDGSLADETVLTCTPREQRGRIWSSFSAVVPVPVADPWQRRATVPYAINLWYVFDPHEPGAAPVLRWSRRGFFAGTCMLDGAEAFVMMCERDMDGVIDGGDAWGLAPASDPSEALGTSFRALDDHAWLGERAYRVAVVDPSGLLAVLLPHDPGISRAEEAEQRDRYAADRRAPRSGRTVAFMHDFAEAQARARAERRLLLIDFETAWCGPCKQMDKWVYTADEVVDASREIVAVKVDGDESRDLAGRFEVRGYPTVILVGADGAELRRNVGYLGVGEMAAFLAGRP